MSTSLEGFKFMLALLFLGVVFSGLVRRWLEI